MSNALQTAQRLHKGNPKTLARLKASRRLQVRDFHEVYGAPIGTTSLDDIPRNALRLGLILEEVRELLLDGYGVELQLDYLVDDVPYTNLAEALSESTVRNKTEIADALGDISYVVDGMAIELDIPLDEVIDEIHASNMTKVGEDGKAILREDGKVLKGPYYVKPNINSIVGN